MLDTTPSITLSAIISKWRPSPPSRLRTYPPSSPTTTGPVGFVACRIVVSTEGGGCTTASPTRLVLFRTVLAFCVPLIGSNSDSRVATLPNGANAA
jgi:hypothetical protein